MNSGTRRARRWSVRSLIGLCIQLLVIGCATTPESGRGSSTPSTAVADGPAAAVGALHALLEPYGQWTRDDEHGWVWTPDPTQVGPEFIPYTNGRFVPTQVGLLFVSDYPWGWITFHYGRWSNDPVAGWHWVPGDNWAPAWVGWRHGGGVVGWAPLPPRRRRAVSSAPSWWVFVAEVDLGQSSLRQHLLPRQRLREAMGRSTPANQVVSSGSVRWYRGPVFQPPPSAMRTERLVRLAPPPAGRLVRLRISGAKATLQDRGAVVLQQPRPDVEGEQPQVPRERPGSTARRPSRAMPGNVPPVMPPLDDDEGTKRWQ